MDLHWDGRTLWVNSDFAAREDCHERVFSAILNVMKFRKATSSRWVTFGVSCRSLIAAQAVGLDGLVAQVRSDPKCSDFYIHGYSKLSTRIGQYCAATALASNVADSVILLLLEDDRVVPQLESLEQATREELTWLSDLSWYTWRRLASLSDQNATGAALRTATIGSGLTIRAFLEQKLFKVARGYPWRLAIGDVGQNLSQLFLSQTPPRDQVTARIQKLLKAGSLCEKHSSSQMRQMLQHFARAVFVTRLQRVLDQRRSGLAQGSSVDDQGCGAGTWFHGCVSAIP